MDRFLDDLEARFGGADAVLLWATYPNMGVDERSQFDLMDDLPGGLPALKAAADRFHARGVRVGLLVSSRTTPHTKTAPQKIQTRTPTP